jgi:hypothetical protein
MLFLTWLFAYIGLTLIGSLVCAAKSCDQGSYWVTALVTGFYYLAFINNGLPYRSHRKILLTVGLLIVPYSLFMAFGCTNSSPSSCQEFRTWWTIANISVVGMYLIGSYLMRVTEYRRVPRDPMHPPFAATHNLTVEGPELFQHAINLIISELQAKAPSYCEDLLCYLPKAEYNKSCETDGTTDGLFAIDGSDYEKIRYVLLHELGHNKLGTSELVAHTYANSALKAIGASSYRVKTSCTVKADIIYGKD